eukprot:6106519-Amphidinium_carterae.1
MREHATALHTARLGELTKLFELGCFKRMSKGESTNVVDVRWVYRWKRIEEKRQIKARITLRGFKDRT